MKSKKGRNWYNLLTSVTGLIGAMLGLTVVLTRFAAELILICKSDWTNVDDLQVELMFSVGYYIPITLAFIPFIKSILKDLRGES